MDLPFMTKLEPDAMWVTSVMCRRAVGEVDDVLVALDIEGRLIGNGSEVDGTLVIRASGLGALRDMIDQVLVDVTSQQN